MSEIVTLRICVHRAVTLRVSTSTTIKTKEDIRQVTFGSWIVFFNVLTLPFALFDFITPQFFYFAFSQMPLF